MELADGWRAAGHTVEHFSLSEAFPRGHAAPPVFAVRQLLFAYKAADFVKKNAERFDVIDALIGSLAGSKQKLGFKGLLVARSVGLYRLYECFENKARKQQPRRRGSFFGRIFYGLTTRWSHRTSDAAVREADLVNVPNEEENECLRTEVGSGLAITVQPYGLTNERRQALAQAAASAEKRLALKKISFVGMWAPRKGSRDWPRIIRLVWQVVPDARFSFFGTMVNPERIYADLGLQSSGKVECFTEYSQEILPSLLADCVAGAFPSYVEGFGIAVLEQMAAGIPTVAFDVSGPRDIVGRDLSHLLAPPGDVEKFVALLVGILQSDSRDYQTLREQCLTRAQHFTWSDIARDTAQVYRQHLLETPGHGRATDAR